MERSDILTKIIDTENKAKEVRESAVRIQKELASNIAAAVQKMREEQMKDAEKKIADFEKGEIKRADDELARLSKLYEDKVRQLHDLYRDKNEKWADKLLGMTIGN
jgi:endonuclease III-like uncharacterized protein